MDQQVSFPQHEYAGKKKTTRREGFLKEPSAETDEVKAARPVRREEWRKPMRHPYLYPQMPGRDVLLPDPSLAVVTICRFNRRPPGEKPVIG